MKKAIVLVVEDDNYKYDRIKRVVADSDVGNCDVVRQKTTQEAYSWLRSNRCDLLVLDLVLPRRGGELPSMDAGVQFLERIQRQGSGCNLPPRVIGLTGYGTAQQQYGSYFNKQGFVLAEYSNDSVDWEDVVSHTLLAELEGMRIKAKGLLIPLHGIRTIADWHRTLADLAFRESWYCSVSGWWYGKFSVAQLFLPFSRQSKVAWFRDRYGRVMIEQADILGRNGRPSVVAHSFGTFIVGNALLKYRHIKLDKVILCGSILPRDFPWNELVKCGQVNSVLNCIGAEDIWPRVSSYFVPGTGASGCYGFSAGIPSLREVKRNLGHSEFFDVEQMRECWFQFLEISESPREVAEVPYIEMPRGDHPHLAPLLSVVFALTSTLALLVIAYWICLAYVSAADWLVMVVLRVWDKAMQYLSSSLAL